MYLGLPGYCPKSTCGQVAVYNDLPEKQSSGSTEDGHPSSYLFSLTPCYKHMEKAVLRMYHISRRDVLSTS
jgi:hypothetical protein